MSVGAGGEREEVVLKAASAWSVGQLVHHLGIHQQRRHTILSKLEPNPPEDIGLVPLQLPSRSLRSPPARG